MVSDLDLQHRIVVCGLGTIGANAVDALVRRGFQNVCAVDGELVSEHDILLPPFGWADVGAYRSKSIARVVFRATGHELDVVGFNPTADNVDLLIEDPYVCVNAFDNGPSRDAVSDYCAQADIPCLHVAASVDRFDLFWVADNADDNVGTGTTEQWIAAAFVASTVERFVASGTLEVAQLRVA